MVPLTELYTQRGDTFGRPVSAGTAPFAVLSFIQNSQCNLNAARRATAIIPAQKCQPNSHPKSPLPHLWRFPHIPQSHKIVSSPPTPSNPSTSATLIRIRPSRSNDLHSKS